MAHSYSHLFGLPTTGLRFFTVYGPWGRPDMAPMLFTKAILAGEPIRRVQRRTHAARLHVRRRHRRRRRAGAATPARRDRRRGAPYAVYNIGNHEAVPLVDIHRDAASGCSAAGDPRHAPMQPGDVPRDVRGDRPARGADRIRAAHAARRRPRALRRVVPRVLRRDSWCALRHRGGLCSWTGGPSSTSVAHHDSRHRRRRLHRLQLRARLARRDRRAASSTSTSSPTPATSATWRRSRDDPRHVFVRGDIGDRALVARAARASTGRAPSSTSRPRRHVDRSIHGPAAFIADQHRRHVQRCSRRRAHYWSALPAERRAPRSASCTCPPTRSTARSAATSRVHARRRRTRRTARTRRRRPRPTTWCAPTTTPTACRRSTTNCSNNYGPYQFPEKLIPLMIVNALAGKPLPVYGDGRNVRDWLYVGDHCAAIRAGARSAAARRDLQRRRRRGDDATSTSCTTICAIAATSATAPARATTRRSITFVTDRPGPRPPLRDRRRARSARELGWAPARDFETGLRKTVRWYLDNDAWLRRRRERGLPQVDRRCNTRAAERHASHGDEGHHPRRRLRHAAVPGHARRVASSCCRSTTSRWSTTRCRR